MEEPGPESQALKREERREVSTLLQELKRRAQTAPVGSQIHRPLGINGWMLGCLLGCLGTEWLLRKRWDLL